MQQIYDIISKNKTVSRYMYKDRTLLVSAPESTEGVSAVAYRLGLRGHMTHLQLPLEMCHTAKIEPLSD